MSRKFFSRDSTNCTYPGYCPETVNCNCNYIIVVPFKDLATSIELDENNKYPVFKLYGGILKSSFKKYLLNNDIRKIVVTYDSLNKLINWLGESITEYKVLVDEYHLILEDLDDVSFESDLAFLAGE